MICDEPKKTVLVCVTPQQSSKKLVEAGKALAAKNDCDLEVISVLPMNFDGDASVPQAIECIYRFAKQSGAQMAIYFNNDPALTVAAHAAVRKPLLLVTGFPGEDSNDFISTIHLLMPELPISMVGADALIYNMLPFDASFMPMNV